MKRMSLLSRGNDVARTLVSVSMGPGGGPTEMHENPHISRPLPRIWGWVFEAAASTLVSTHSPRSGSHTASSDRSEYAFALRGVTNRVRKASR